LCPVNLPGTAYHHLLRLAERIEDQILAIIAKRRASGERQSNLLSLLIDARDDKNRGRTDTELVG